MSRHEITPKTVHPLYGHEPSTHDYAENRWGHAIEILTVEDEGKSLWVAGFGLGVDEGDFIILDNHGRGEGTTRYQVTEISYYRDPPDMWTGLLTFAPRQWLTDS